MSRLRPISRELRSLLLRGVPAFKSITICCNTNSTVLPSALVVKTKITIFINIMYEPLFACLVLSESKRIENVTNVTLSMRPEWLQQFRAVNYSKECVFQEHSDIGAFVQFAMAPMQHQSPEKQVSIVDIVFIEFNRYALLGSTFQ